MINYNLSYKELIVKIDGLTTHLTTYCDIEDGEFVTELVIKQFADNGIDVTVLDPSQVDDELKEKVKLTTEEAQKMEQKLRGSVIKAFIKYGSQ